MTVLDLSRVLAGPWASQVLGDLGADVIKIEQPGVGDDTRRWGPPFVGTDTTPSDAAYYLCCNRNKRSVTVDFAHPAGAAIIRDLATHADIVLENFKPGGLAKYGLDYQSLRSIKPDLIYCSITGFGQYGPYAERGGYDFLVQGMSGLMSITGRPDGEPGSGPLKVGIPVSDLFTGQYAAISILAAITHRLRTGEGQYIDCALLDSQIAVLVNQAMNYLVGGTIPQRLGNAHPNVVPYRDFATADGFILIAVGNDRQFAALCKLLARTDLLADERFTTNVNRVQNRERLEVALASAILPWNASPLLEAMAAAGIPGGPVNQVNVALTDAHLDARRMIHRLRRRDGTDIPVIGYPAQLSRSPASYRLAPPGLGEDTLDVMQRLLGKTTQEIDTLLKAGVISAPRGDIGG
jgi:crotonobetainyl-CoA:carnitine CoA-transferase CaiB-like acyl-CoA transferase